MWLRMQCLIMSQNNHTPVGFWLSLPLTELRKWIAANNELSKK